MNAILSAQRRVAFLVDEDQLHSIITPQSHVDQKASLEFLARWLQGAEELIFLEDIDAASVQNRLREEVRRERAFCVFLPFFDSMLDANVREKAGEELEALFDDDDSLAHLTLGRFYDAPFPQIDRLQDAVSFATNHPWPRLHHALADLAARQPIVRKVCLQWAAIRPDSFDGTLPSDEIRETFVRQGVFYRLVEILATGLSLVSFISIENRNRYLNHIPHLDVILRRWTETFAPQIAKPEGSPSRKAIGIDLGTSFCAVAHVDDFGKPQIIPNFEGERTTPAVILFDDANVIVGTRAMQNAVAEPEKTVNFVKREMGKSKARFHRAFGGKAYSAEELSALIIKKLKNDAETQLGQRVTDAVITVPAYFNDAERTATLHAGQLAGLNVLQIVNEPMAAALAYGLDKLDSDQTVFVFDLGGGTLDVTILRIENHQFRMIASNGDHHLGGKDWDDIIVNLVADEFNRLYGENPLLDLRSYQDLYNRALTAKIQLSSRTRTTIQHSYNGRSVKLDLTRADYENRCQPLLEKCKSICKLVIREANLDWKTIDRILLTGGMTRMPSVRDMVKSISNVPVADGVNPEEAMAIGAAVQGVLSLLNEENKFGERVLPKEVRNKFSKEDGSLIKVTNIATHTLGVILWDDGKVEEYVFPMIRKMTVLPVEAKNSFGTAKADMRNAIVRVVEGESTVPGKCTPLGICDIELPPFLPKGSPVELTYTYDENQVLEVIVDAYGRQNRVKIVRSTGLSESEIDQATADMVQIHVV
ncbi:MAG: Hsp70 family protein [Chthoniobacter sp.]|uniref:Hsp70 family protein n=1 Tax=Chthoniobacter sp. TaxID=2510640 RepID=UPI0032A58854